MRMMVVVQAYAICFVAFGVAMGPFRLSFGDQSFFNDVTLSMLHQIVQLSYLLLGGALVLRALFDSSFQPVIDLLECLRVVLVAVIFVLIGLTVGMFFGVEDGSDLLAMTATGTPVEYFMIATLIIGFPVMMFVLPVLVFLQRLGSMLGTNRRS